MPKSPSLTRQIQVAQIANPDSRVGWLFGRGRLAVHLERYNPDDLVGRHGLAIYDEMRQDDQVKAALGLKKAAIIGPGWKLDAASDEPADQALRDRIMDDLDRLPGPMSDVLSGLLTGLDYGFALMEMVFLTDAEDGGRLRLAKLQSIAPHGITFDQLPTGDIVAIRQDGNGEAMPPGKFLHYVHMPEFANPYGTSDLRSAHRSWWHKQNWVQWFAVWGEKLADAPILITAAKGASNEEVATARNTAEHLQARTVMTVPEGWAVQLLEQGRDVRSVFLEAIDHHDRQMGKALLVPDKMGMVGGEVQGGSFSLSKTQMGAFLFTIELEQRALEACVQEQLINRIAQFIDPAAEPPTFALLPLAEEDTVAVAQAWQTVLAGGMPETSRDWNHTRMLLGYPEMSPEEVEEAQAAKKQAKRDMARQVAGGGAQAGGGTDDDDEGEDEDEDDRAEDAAALSFNPNQPRVPKGNATGGQWTDGGGGTGDVFARAVPPSAGLKSDDGFVYHATSLDNLVGIVDDGALVPHGPSYGTDQDAWPDGSTARRSYWSANAGVVWQFAPEHGRPVIVRAPATLVPGRESGTGDLFTRKPVPARDLEILTTRGWESVIPDVRLNYDRNQPRVPAGNAHGGRWTDGQGIEQRIAIESHPTAFLVEAELSDAQVPSAHMDGLRAIRFQDAEYIERQSAASGKVVEALGIYEPKAATITLSGNAPNSGNIKVFGGAVVLHEVGHHVHLSRLSDTAAAEWAAISQNGATARISAYARSNAGEHFADAYRAYARGNKFGHRRKLKVLEPAAYKFMARLWRSRSADFYPSGRGFPGDWWSRYDPSKGGGA